jgi:hypothetical protein
VKTQSSSLTDGNFNKAYHSILANKMLDHQQKLIIIDILSFQLNNQKYFRTIVDIAESIGVSDQSIKRSISKLIKYDWFSNTKNSLISSTGGHFNTSIRSINIDLFEDFLKNNIQPLLNPNDVKLPPIKLFKEVNAPVEQITSTIINNEFQIDENDDMKQTEFKKHNEEMKTLPKVTTNEDGSINITMDHTTSNKSEVDEFLMVNGDKPINYITAHVDFMDGETPIIDEVVKDKFDRYISKYLIEKRFNVIKAPIQFEDDSDSEDDDSLPW